MLWFKAGLRYYCWYSDENAVFVGVGGEAEVIATGHYMPDSFSETEGSSHPALQDSFRRELIATPASDSVDATSRLLSCSLLSSGDAESVFSVGSSSVLFSAC